MSDLLWWAYRHSESNKLIIKRYFDKKDIEEAHESPFCECITGPFIANNATDAMLVAEQRIPK